MYVFATPYARRNLFSAFWTTHLLYIGLYGFMLMHGSGRLVQAPLTQNFLYGPLLVYAVDKLISISRKKVEIAVKKAELLPSGKFFELCVHTNGILILNTWYIGTALASELIGRDV